MCGLLFESSNRLLVKNKFNNLLRLSKKRGPDYQGYWTNNVNVQMGFNRLSIMDVSSNGNQPMLSSNQRWVILFNGEIYNHLSLRKNCKYNFQGLSDSESLLANIQNYGFENSIKKLKGMFAIVAFDKMQNKIYIARDYSGIKPLFYYFKEECIVISSQFDQIFKYPKVKEKIQLNRELVGSYFSLGYMQSPETIFNHILQVLPGQMITITNNFEIKKTIFKQYYPKKKIFNYNNFNSDILLEKLDKVVKEHIISDVPIATFLSGGIDSPLITALAYKYNKNITAYTIGVDDVEFDESNQAIEYAKKIGINHKIIFYSKNELLESIDDHFSCYNEPFGDYSSLPTFLISRYASEKNKVMLSGDGGDELFWGYPRMMNVNKHLHWFYLSKKYRKYFSYVLRKFGIDLSYSINNFNSIQDWYLDIHSYISQEKVNSFFNEPVGLSQSVENIYYKHFDLNKKDQLLYLRWNEFYAHLQKILIKVDRASMGNSLEVRVPFLDSRIVDFAWDLEPWTLKSNQSLKYILKDALCKIIDSKKINVVKSGFGVPLKKWMLNELKEEIQDLIFCSDIFGSEILNQLRIRNYVQKFFNEKKINERGIWQIYCWQKWAKNHFLN